MKTKKKIFEKEVLSLLFLIFNRIILRSWSDYLLTSVWIFIVFDLIISDFYANWSSFFSSNTFQLIHLKVLTCRILSFCLFIYEECIFIFEIHLIVWATVSIKCDVKTKKKFFFWLFLILNQIVLRSWFDYFLTLMWIFIVLDLIIFDFYASWSSFFFVERNLLWFKVFETFH